MKKINCFFYALVALLSSQLVSADVYNNYEDSFPQNVYNRIYPSLELQEVNKVKITTSLSPFSVEREIDSVEIQFPNATNLKAKNFKFVNGRYVSIIKDVWVFSKIMVEVEADVNLFNTAIIRVYIVEHNNLNNDLFSAGHLMLDVQATLLDVTPSKVVDSSSSVFDGKQLDLKLYQRASMSVNGENVFKISSVWFGNGERELQIHAPFPSDQNSRHKAVAIKLFTDTLPDGETIHFISVDFENESGDLMSTGMEDLRMLMDRYYPAN